MLNLDLMETKAGQEIYQEGMDKGMEKGLLYDAQEMVMDILDAKFGIIPSDVAHRVKKIKERKTLQSLHRNVLRCETIDGFRVLLDESKLKRLF